MTQRREIVSFLEVEKFSIANENLYVFSKINQSILCINLFSWKKKFEIHERFKVSSMMIVNDYTIVCLADKRKSKIYDGSGRLILELNQRIWPALSYINNNTVLFRTPYLGRNNHELWIELNLNNQKISKWSVLNIFSTGELLFEIKDNLFFLNGRNSGEEPYICKTDKYLGEQWRKYLKDIYPNFNQKYYSSKVHKFQNSIIFWIENSLFALDANNGIVKWKILNITDTPKLQVYQKLGYIFSITGDYIRVDLEQGKIKNKIKNCFD